jgi:hypothetical protein
VCTATVRERPEFIINAEYPRIKTRIEEGEAKRNKRENLGSLLYKKINSVRYPMQELELNYPTTKGKVYSEEEDRYLLCRLDHYGMQVDDVYERIKRYISEFPVFRFNRCPSDDGLAPFKFSVNAIFDNSANQRLKCQGNNQSRFLRKHWIGPKWIWRVVELHRPRTPRLLLVPLEAGDRPTSNLEIGESNDLPKKSK